MAHHVQTHCSEPLNRVLKFTTGFHAIMRKYLQIFLLAAGILATPFWTNAQTRLIHAEWQYPATEDVAGYRLYHAGQPVCETADPAAIAMDCTIDAPDGEAFFTLTTYFQDDMESPASEPFSYIFSSDLQAIAIANTLEGEAPLSVSFDGSASTGNIVSYEWMFGDGSTGFGSTIDHTFASSGSYAVSLKVTDDQGATDQETVTVTVTGSPMADMPPAAVISSSATVGSVPLQVHFDGSSSSDKDGSIVSHQWDLGDGATAAGAMVTHTYTTAGTFTAKLTVTDDDGLTGSTTTPVLTSLPSGETNTAPEAVISTSSNQGLIPLAVAFDASGSHDPDGEIISYAWNFGDGTTESGISVAHLYTQAAVYTVTLEVTDNRGAASRVTRLINAQSGTEEPSFALELGTILINSDWTRVQLIKQFANPVVVAGPISYNDSDPAVVRIRNVDATFFDIKIQEWDYLDGFHAHETVHYIVMEEGSYTLGDGTQIESGTFTAGILFGSQKFKETFQSKPVLLTSILSVNEEDAVTRRIRKLSTGGFDCKLSEQEINKFAHADETVGYIAWTPGTGRVGQFTYEAGNTPDSVTHLWHRILLTTQFTESPLFFADMQSYDSGENSTVRHQFLPPASVLVSIEEEESKDSETAHATETVGYLVFN